MPEMPEMPEMLLKCPNDVALDAAGARILVSAFVPRSPLCPAFCGQNPWHIAFAWLLKIPYTLMPRFHFIFIYPNANASR